MKRTIFAVRGINEENNSSLHKRETYYSGKIIVRKAVLRDSLEDAQNRDKSDVRNDFQD